MAKITIKTIWYCNFKVVLIKSKYFPNYQDKSRDLSRLLFFGTTTVYWTSEKHPHLHIPRMHHRIAFAGAAVINKIELHVAAQRALNAESPGEIAAGL